MSNDEVPFFFGWCPHCQRLGRLAATYFERQVQINGRTYQMGVCLQCKTTYNILRGMEPGRWYSWKDRK